MKHSLHHWFACLLLLAGTAQAIEPGDVREYGDVFAISAEAVAPDRIEVAWDIADDYFLYNNRFLAFAADTPGVVLGEPDIPEGKRSFDELLGEEVVKYTGRLVVGVPLASVPPGTRSVSLNIRSQGCLESVLCYPPTRQVVTVSLPEAVPGAAPATVPALSGATGSPLDELLGGAVSTAGDPALPPEQAFRYEAITQDAGTVLVRFTAAPGYYLYVDKFAFRVTGDAAVTLGPVERPQGTLKDDPEFGVVPVIYDQVEIPVKVNRLVAGTSANLELEADWQGCRDGDICYPPQTGRLAVTLPAVPEPLLHDAGDSTGADPREWSG